MPIDTSIYNVGGGGGGQQFDFLGNMMKMYQFGEQIQNNRLINEERQERIEERRRKEEAYRWRNEALQKFSDPDNPMGIDLAGAAQYLNENQQGDVALGLRGDAEKIMIDQLNNQKQRTANLQSRVQMGANQLRRIQQAPEADRASLYQGLLPTLKKIAPEFADQLQPEYDNDYVRGLITAAQTTEQNLTERKNLFDEGQTLLTNSITDVPKLTEYFARAYSAANSQQDWDAVTGSMQSMTSLMTPKDRASVMDNFKHRADFTTENQLHARNLAMTPEAREAANLAREKFEQTKAEDAKEDELAKKMTPQTKRKLAEEMVLAGALPQGMLVSRGPAVQAVRDEITNMAAEMIGTGTFAGNRAVFKAHSDNLSYKTRQMSNLYPYEENAMRNMGTVLQALDQITDTKSPFFNKPLREWGRAAVGSPEYLAYQAAVQMFTPEMAGLVTTANLNNVVTQASRDDFARLLPLNATKDEVRRVLGTMYQDSQNRLKTMRDELDFNIRVVNGISGPTERGASYDPWKATGVANPLAPQGQAQEPPPAALPSAAQQLEAVRSAAPAAAAMGKPGESYNTMNGGRNVRVTNDAQGQPATFQLIGPNGELGKVRPFPGYTPPPAVGTQPQQQQQQPQQAPTGPTPMEPPSITAPPGVATPPRTIPMQPQFQSQIPGGIGALRGRNLPVGGSPTGPATVTQPPPAPAPAPTQSQREQFQLGNIMRNVFGRRQEQLAPASSLGNVMSVGGTTTTDRQQAINQQRIIQTTRFDDMIDTAVQKYTAPGLTADLVRAVIAQESKFNPIATSSKGATGLMQVMPRVAKDLGVDPKKLTDPQTNIEAGVKLLQQLLQRYNGDVIKALAAYNSNPTAVDKHGGVPPFKETRDYVRLVAPNAIPRSQMRRGATGQF